jgi:hypothetical protein
VGSFAKTQDGFTFQWKCRVPLAKDSGWDAESLAREHFTDRYDIYQLQLTGLPEGTYELFEGDKSIVKFKAEEAQKGLDLLSASALPTNEHAVQVIKLIQQRQRLQTDAWLNETGHKRPGMAKGLPVAEADQKAAELNAQIQKLVQPVVLKFRVARVL